MVPGSARTPGQPTTAQHGAKREIEREREKRKREPTTHATKEEARETTEQDHKDKKGATEARKRTGAHGTSSCARGTPKPQREETNPTTSTRAPRRASKQERERERERATRKEKRGYKLTPGSSTATRTTKRPRRCLPNCPQHTYHAGTGINQQLKQVQELTRNLRPNSQAMAEATTARRRQRDDNADDDPRPNSLRAGHTATPKTKQRPRQPRPDTDTNRRTNLTTPNRREEFLKSGAKVSRVSTRAREKPN